MKKMITRLRAPAWTLCGALVSTVFLASFLAACAQTASLSGGEEPSAAASSSDVPGALGRQTATRFSDVPIPAGAKTDPDKTLVFGDEIWFGQVSLSVGEDPARLFDFFKVELPGFGWEEISSIQAPTSVLTYQRAGRVLSITITEATLLGSNVTLSMSPRGQRRGSGGGQGRPDAANRAPQAVPNASGNLVTNKPTERPLVRPTARQPTVSFGPEPSPAPSTRTSRTAPLSPAASGTLIPAPPSLPPPPKPGIQGVATPQPGPLFPGPSPSAR